MQSTFENLPDEILMMIFAYSNDVYSVLRTFLGLNQRINKVLLDKRLHLLLDFLCISVDHRTVSSYYDLWEFRNVIQRLASFNRTISENEIVQCLEALVRCHVKMRFIKLGNEFQFLRNRFQSLRIQLKDEELENDSNKLQEIFHGLGYKSDKTQEIHSLLYKYGTTIEYSDGQNDAFDLARIINAQMVIFYNLDFDSNRKQFSDLISIFKGLIIMNSKLLKVSYYLSYGFDVVHYLLFTVFRRRFMFSSQSSTINIYYYQSLVDLALLSIQAIVNDKLWSESYLFEILNIFTKSNTESMTNNQNIIFRITEIELLKILLDQSHSNIVFPYNEDINQSLVRSLNHLIKYERTDIFIMMYRHNQFLQNFFRTTDYMEHNINIMLGSPERKKFINQLINEKSSDSCFIRTSLLFELVKKKQFRILKNILRLSNAAVNALDKDGNDLLLYLCLKVRGCRHRFVEYLIRIGCSTERKNYLGQSFFDAIQLTENRRLFAKLLDFEVIDLDKLSGRIEVLQNS